VIVATLDNDRPNARCHAGFTWLGAV